MPPLHPRTYLTPGQLCRRLAVSKSWLRVHRSEFDVIRIAGRGQGGEYRYSVESVERFELQHAQAKRIGRTIREIVEQANAAHPV